MTDAILTINAGSSSIKFAVFEVVEGADPHRTVHGKIEEIGQRAHLVARGADDQVIAEKNWPDGARATHEDVFQELLSWLQSHLGEDRLVAAGHRVVHGGRDLIEPALVTDEVLAQLQALVPLAPLHQPHAISAIRAVLAISPELPQIACFDTSFHRGHAAEVREYGLPRALTDSGIERYGFHGLSYAYIASVLPDALAGAKVVVAHLGNGASLCALSAAKSLESTMGFTALDGLVMGTRCGALDPGVVLYLLQDRQMSPGEIETLLYTKSGLLGVSGISSDMRELLASDDPCARDAVALFTFRIARELCSLMAVLGGLDGIVFTAGIGEGSPRIRQAVCERLAWLGVKLDHAANAAGQACISLPDSRIAVWMLPTDEEKMIARGALGAL
jgi:acetate kinase